MIKLHPNIDERTVIDEIQRELNVSCPKGLISLETLRLLYNLFSWVYMENSTDQAFEENDKDLKEFFLKYDLFRFKGESLAYSAVLFYTKLNKKVNLELLGKGIVCEYSEGDNKLLGKDKFSFRSLYEMYKSSDSDISDNMLNYNSIFTKNISKEVSKIRSYGDIMNAVSKTDLVRPDIGYKIVSKELNVNLKLENESEDDRKMYVLQDCTQSMSNFLPALKALKAFILNEALINDYTVEWLCVHTEIASRESLSRFNIENVKFNFNFIGYVVNLSEILRSDELCNKKVTIITDGTDDFNFPFNINTKDINVISFSNNINIKDKIVNYGRFFQIK